VTPLLAVIPARGGSKGVPGKNVAEVGGLPLIAWTIRAALEARAVGQVVVSTDDEGIAEVARAHGAEVPFLRPAELSTDDAPAAGVVRHVLDALGAEGAFAFLQPTSPLRTAEDIDAAAALMNTRGASTVVSVRPAREAPQWTYFQSEDGHLEPVVPVEAGATPRRRQDLRSAWVLNGALYLSTVEAFRRTGVFVDLGTVAYPMSLERSLDVDTHEDLERARAALLARTERGPGSF